MIDFDIIVIGGGPSGLQTAKLLSESGHCVALFEKDSEIGKEVVCSGVIGKEAFERFGLPQDSIIGRLQEAELYSPSNRNINYHHPEQSVVVVDRHRFDSFLGKRANEHGTEIFLNSRVTSLINNGSHVTCTVKHNDKTLTFRSLLAVIATGVSFNLQESLGMGRPKKILKGIQVEIEVPDLERLKMFWGNQYSRGFFGWTIPLANGKARIGVMTEENPRECLGNLVHSLGLKEKFEKGDYKIQRRGISFGKLKNTVAGRIIAVGEAAGLVKTTTGGGIYYGLISAEIASGVIKSSYRNYDFDIKALQKYEKLLRNEFYSELKFGEYFHRFYSTLSDYEINELFDAAKKDNLLSFISEKGKFDWHRDAVLKILRSPNLRKVLFKGLVRQGSKVALSQ